MKNKGVMVATVTLLLASGAFRFYRFYQAEQTEKRNSAFIERMQEFKYENQRQEKARIQDSLQQQRAYAARQALSDRMERLRETQRKVSNTLDSLEKAEEGL